MTDKERDDALIAEAERLAYDETKTIVDDRGSTWTVATEDDWQKRKNAHLIRLARENWQPAPEPDRWTLLTRKALAACNRGNKNGGHYDEASERAAEQYEEGSRDNEGAFVAMREVLREHFPERRPAVVVPEDQIKRMTNRFLGWKLPEDFHPDDGISFEPEFNKEWNSSQGKPPQRRTPTGTNLFDATQAEAMVRYIIDQGGE